MSTAWRARVLQQHRVEAQEEVAAAGVDDRSSDEIESDLRVATLEIHRLYDQEATLDNELRIRFSGTDAVQGSLDFDMGDALLKPLQDSVSAAANQVVTLKLVGLSKGSTVLHVRPVPKRAVENDAGDALPVEAVQDYGMTELLALVRALEDEGDVGHLATLLSYLDHVTDALDKFGIQMDLTWLRSDGQVRSAALTRRGCDYAARLRTVRPATEEITVSGHITELKQAGVVKVKSGTSPRAQAFDVKFEDPSVLVRMRLALGDNVTFRVKKTQSVDSVNRTKSTTYQFLGMLEEHPKLL
ncbi:hypothetical protein PUR71_28830 [Streptomyces sp. SP17BM10]|uniref:hypothetical protein n=1 Tax=Streptomyces sp. SP17BM10 TaxID=3002530 RepID=UPI002E7A3529|nr:hypothetical protein [Streptomyces sp. SP17BM10]MEE1786879.1 hypothetical protein [Streptomyces sp. SP17BM10]